MRYKVTISYDGSRFMGSQIQLNDRTVQGELIRVFSKYFDEEIAINLSGRTDRGVHALNQVFHFDTAKEFDISKTIYSLNKMLENDILIKSMEPVSDDFHARYSVKEKTYLYRIIFTSKDPFNREHFYVCPYPTNIELFKEVLNLFIGKHNFMNFTSKEEDEDGFIREIYSINFEENDNNFDIRITGNGFMRYMIRFLVGTALAAAQNKENIENVKLLLSAKERNIVSYKAPAEGLYLENVKY